MPMMTTTANSTEEDVHEGFPVILYPVPQLNTSESLPAARDR
jgi:hypothetical protein